MLSWLFVAGRGGDAARRPMFSARRPWCRPKLQRPPDRPERRLARLLSRRMSQARNSSRSSRSVAFRPAWNNGSRCDGLSRAQPSRAAETRSTRRICEPFENGTEQGNHKNGKRKYGGRAVPASAYETGGTRTTDCRGLRRSAPAYHHLDNHDHDVLSKADIPRKARPLR